MRGLLRFLPIGVVAVGCTAPTLPDPPPPAAEESERWVQDVEYSLAVLDRMHPALYTNAPRWAFEAEVARVKASMPDAGREGAFLGLMRLVALAGDAHTRLASWDEIGDRRLPVGVEHFSDGYWISAVEKDWRRLFARRVLAIEGVPMRDVAARLAPWLVYENEAQLGVGTASAVSFPTLLRTSGLSTDPDRVRFRLLDRAGKEEDVVIEARDRASFTGLTFFIPSKQWTPPLHRERCGEDWWWRVLDDGGTLYLQYNRCIWRTDHPFEETANEVLARIDQGIERLVVDLRNNGGGDSDVLRPLIQGLQERAGRFSGSRIYVAIGLGTFSSAEINARQLKIEAGALLVGEPTLQKPDGFGELRTVTLPNTGWRLDYSTKRYLVFGDDRPALAPDVPVPFGFASVLDGRDPVMEWILSPASPR